MQSDPLGPGNQAPYGDPQYGSANDQSAQNWQQGSFGSVTAETGFSQAPVFGQMPGYDQAIAYGQAPGYDQANAYSQTSGYNQANAYGQAPGYEQTNAYGQAPGYDQANAYGQAQAYDQANAYGQAQAYDQANAYGQAQAYDQASAYGQAQAYDQANAYGQAQAYEQANAYGQAPGYDQANAYGQAQAYEQANAYGQAPGYDQSNAYGQAQAYEQANAYGQAQAYDQTNAYGQASGYDQANAYGQAQAYDQANAYGQAPGYDQANAYGQAQAYDQTNAYGQAPGYDQSAAYGQAPSYDQANAYGQAPGYDQSAAYGQAPSYAQANAYGQAQAYAQSAAYSQATGYGGSDPAFSMPQQGYGSPDHPAAPQNGGNDDTFIQTDYEMPQMEGASPEGKKPRKIREPRTKKPGISKKNWLIAAVVVLVICVVGYLLLRGVGNPVQNTAVIEFAQMGETHSGTALIVRDETAYSEEGVQSIDYVAQEGSVVNRGDVICRVYSTGYSAKETTTLQSYRDQIRDYQMTLLAEETSYDQKMTRLENDVIDKGLGVRSLVQGATGNMMQQEEALESAIDDRQSYFRSKYSSDMRMDRYFDNEETQQQRIDSWIKQKIATSESIVSFYTDGFESALSPDNYGSYSPSQVRSMIAGNKPNETSSARGRTDLYRLIQPNNFAVLLLLDDTHWNPAEGEVYKLVLEQYTDMVVDARVLSFTRSGGDLLVRLAVIGDIQQILYTRSCTAKLGEYVDCMSVPESAIYEQNDMQGVVVYYGDRSVFVPVTILGRGDGLAYISAVNTGTLSEGQTVRLFK